MDSARLNLVNAAPAGAGPSAVMPGQTAPDNLDHVTAPPVCVVNPVVHGAFPAQEVLPPMPPLVPSDNNVLAPSSHHGEGAPFAGASEATHPLVDPATEPQVPA